VEVEVDADIVIITEQELMVEQLECIEQKVQMHKIIQVVDLEVDTEGHIAQIPLALRAMVVQVYVSFVSPYRMYL